MPGEGECDAVVIGAGVAGLWVWRRLLARGLDALLLTEGAIGACQTIASQGIIHGGVKYALTGEAGRASAMIAAMPERWRACLEGRPSGADPDLSGVRTLATEQHLWTTRGLVSRLGGVAASKALRTGVKRIAATERPAEFRDAPGDIDLYRVEEVVIDPASLVRALGDGGEKERIIECEPGTVRVMRDAPGGATRVGCAPPGGKSITIRARAVVCAAGAGNEGLLAQARASSAAETEGGGDSVGSSGGAWAQRRPLHMVMVRGSLPRIFGHCVTASPTPRATITSQADGEGRVVWWVGGAVAESGVERGREAQIEHAKHELAACVPWVDLSRAEWATMRIDRAEGLPEGRPRTAGARPDGPVVRRSAGALFAWPTKLAFAPLLADMVEEALAGDNGSAMSAARAPRSSGASRGPVSFAPLPWEEAGVEWN